MGTMEESQLEKGPLAFALRILGFGSMGSMAAEPKGTFEVLGAGFPRTGTKSLKAALRILGYNPFHMDELAANGLVSLANSAFQLPRNASAQRALFDAVLTKGFDSTVDAPLAHLFAEVLENNLEAKVVLTYRSGGAEEWFRSYTALLEAFTPAHGSPFEELGIRIIEMESNKYFGCDINSHWFEPWYAPWVRTVDSITLGPDGQGTGCMEAYDRQQTLATDIVKPENLLLFHIGDGWEPLCDFLGKPVPDVDFPNLNSRGEIATIHAVVRLIAFAYPFLALIPALLVALAFRRCCCRMSRKVKDE